VHLMGQEIRYFCRETLHVSGSSSAHHQEFSTVYSVLVYVVKHAGHIQVPNVQWKTPDDGQRNCPKHVDFLGKNKLGKISASVGFIKKNLLRCTVTWTLKQLLYLSLLRQLQAECSLQQV